MNPIWLLAGGIGFFIGVIFMLPRRRDRVEEWRIEKRVDAILAHHGVTYVLRLPDEVERLAKSGRTGEAVAEFRRGRTVGLKEAYDTIKGRNRTRKKLDTLLAHWRIDLGDRLPDDVERLVRDGRKIEAVKLLRQQTGLNLTMAKEAVESGRISL